MESVEVILDAVVLGLLLPALLGQLPPGRGAGWSVEGLSVGAVMSVWEESRLVSGRSVCGVWLSVGGEMGVFLTRVTDSWMVTGLAVNN